MTSLPTLGGLAALTLLLGSCSSSSQPRYLPGQTMYLHAQPTAGLGTARLTTTRDDGSFWDPATAAGGGRAKIVIDLSDQLASFYKGENLVGMAAISSGDAEHPTPTGTFAVSQKNADHRSNMYGDFMDNQGNTIVRNVAATDKRPAGTFFVGSPMSYFLRFNGAVGMHAGYLPGYPASHGCVRLPEWIARNFYTHASIGTPVIVQP